MEIQEKGVSTSLWRSQGRENFEAETSSFSKPKTDVPFKLNSQGTGF